ncbi:LamG domain-containing protein [Candidatus Woesearchaeota archaeon]|nr:LamG domain-containing protein [Candidatus Woesearchaeota archaeon]
MRGAKAIVFSIGAFILAGVIMFSVAAQLQSPNGASMQRVNGTNCTPSPEGIVAWWPFDEQNGTTTDDVVGSHSGVLVNGPLHVTGLVGQALQFDGGNDYVSVGDSDLWYFGRNNFTIELWMKSFEPGGGSMGHPSHIFIGNDEGSGFRRKWFFALGGGVLEFHINGGVSGTQFFALAPFSPTLNEWYHLAMRRMGNNWTVFVNGLPVVSEMHDYEVPNANAPLTIAQAENLGYVNGVIDEVAIYDRALSNEEIRAIANASQAGKCKQFQISTASPLFAQIDQYVVFQFEALFGKEPLLWSIINGTIPQGMGFYPNGMLNGTPAGVGNFTFTVQVKDALNQTVQKELVMEVLLQLPPPTFTVEKVGTQTVPGQDADYFIMVQNIGVSPTAKVNSSELLEPWFTFLNASPYPKTIVNTSDGWPLPENESLFNQSSYQTFLQWEIPPLQPGGSYLIYYKVNVDPTFPVGEEVTGTFCLTPEEAEACSQTYQDCLQAGMIGCIQKKDLKCVTVVVPTCIFLWTRCLWRGNLDGCGSHEQNTSGSFDPNQKTVLPEKYALPNQTLLYTIDFENIGTAEAKTVGLLDELNQKLNLSTLQVVARNGTFYAINDGQTILLYLQNKTRQKNITFGNETIFINETYMENWTVNRNNNTLRWFLENIYLGINKTDHVFYQIKPKQGLVSGATILNNATIRFDVFDPMTTNNTITIIDSSIPKCTMNALPPLMYSSNFSVSWNGTDAIGEIESFDVYMAADGQGYQRILTRTLQTNTTIVGKRGVYYEFFCVATDMAGNIETQQIRAEASTTVYDWKPTPIKMRVD